jgi:GNAT superfamily N-acetyltransferase/uncharacterized glyoxalase superfamily protein PhnB
MHFEIDTHDSLPPAETALVDEGIGTANDAAAPLHEVRPLACFARDAAGAVLGGAVGRRWGACCELQQLWVQPAQRGQGIGSALVRAFEQQARGHGCRVFYLETFSFQAPDFYRALGYATAHVHDVYPHGIVRHLMVRHDGAHARTADRFDHLFVEPASFDAAVVFYRDGLGWAERFAWGAPGQPRGIALDGGGVSIVLAERHVADDHSKSHGINGVRPTVHVAVDDLDARHAELAAKGLALFAPETTHWGVRWFVVRDPDGNLIAFEQARPR